ncbi:MAG: hypothetical protein P4L46_08635 [Fimbriimonas sp.]|nr:hypothetical protein [Fimbriimonas sp.]
MGSNPKLILIDGLPGSGKSTLAERLTRSLESSGLTCECWYETQTEHPLNPLPPDEMGVAWADIHRLMSVDEFATRSIDRWTRFVREPRSDCTILESFPFQCSVRVLLQMNADRDAIDAYWRSWQKVVENADTCIVFFRETDVEGLIRQTCLLRGPEWTRYLFESIERMRYVEVRGWHGEAAAIGLFRVYAQLLDELLAESTVPVVIDKARPLNYEARHARVIAAVRGH